MKVNLLCLNIIRKKRGLSKIKKKSVVNSHVARINQGGVAPKFRSRKWFSCDNKGLEHSTELSHKTKEKSATRRARFESPYNCCNEEHISLTSPQRTFKEQTMKYEMSHNFEKLLRRKRVNQFDIPNRNAAIDKVIESNAEVKLSFAKPLGLSSPFRKQLYEATCTQLVNKEEPVNVIMAYKTGYVKVVCGSRF